MKHERFIRYDWGHAETLRHEFRPSRKVYAISLGPSDQAGSVTVDGLPGATRTAVVTARSPWLGDVDGEQSTLIFTPTQTLPVGSRAYEHKLDVIVWYEPVVLLGERAPTEKTLSVATAGIDTAILSVTGRRRVSVTVATTGIGTAGVVTITQAMVVNGAIQHTTVYSRSSVPSTTISWSPDKRVISAARTVGAETELDGCHYITAGVNLGADLSATIFMRAED